MVSAKGFCRRAVITVTAERRAGGFFARATGMVEPVALDAPPRGLCPFCWSDHGEREAHKADAPVYLARFQAMHGRAPTIADAIAHMPREARARLKVELAARALWLLPADGAPIIAERFKPPRGFRPL